MLSKLCCQEPEVVNECRTEVSKLENRKKFTADSTIIKKETEMILSTNDFQSNHNSMLLVTSNYEFVQRSNRSFQQLKKTCYFPIIAATLFTNLCTTVIIGAFKITHAQVFP